MTLSSAALKQSRWGTTCCCTAPCRRMWALLQLHAKQCQISDCPVPRCRELREMRKRQMSRQEEQRRRAYQAMLQHQHQSQANSQAGQ